MESVICVSNIKKYVKTVDASCYGRYVGKFEELYFAPLTFQKISSAISIFAQLNKCPIISIHLEESACKECIIPTIHEILRYNYLIGYKEKICLEIRIRTSEGNLRISKLLPEISGCCAAIVIDAQNMDCFNQNNLKYIDFMRVNLGESAGEYLPDMRIPQSSCCYKLARVIVTNDLDVKSMISEVSQAGFDGIQFVKNHKLDVTAILPQSVSQALSNARDSVQKTDVFIESDTIHLNQPLFQMKKCNQGMCLSSLLRVSIENDALLQCPYEMRDLSIPIKEVNSFLEKRSLIDSCEKNCKDCGYISDNVIFENIYFASKNYFE